MKLIRPGKGTVTRQGILTEAKWLIARHGFQATSFQKIADRCEIHQPAIFHYFKTKEDLLQAVLDDLIINSHRVVSRYTDKAKDAHQKLEAHFEGTLAWALEFRDESAILGLLYYYAGFQPEFTEKYQAILDRARFRILSILTEVAHQHGLRAGVRIETLAPLLHDTLLGGIVNAVATGCKSRAITRLRERWKAFFSLFLLQGLTVGAKASRISGRRNEKRR